MGPLKEESKSKDREKSTILIDCQRIVNISDMFDYAAVVDFRSHDHPCALILYILEEHLECEIQAGNFLQFMSDTHR